MNNAELLSLLQSRLGDKIIHTEDTFGMLCIEVSREDFVDTIAWLKEAPELQMAFLTDLCGVHYPDNKGKELGIVCHLHGLAKNIRLRVKSFFPIEDPTF